MFTTPVIRTEPLNYSNWRKARFVPLLPGGQRTHRSGRAVKMEAAPQDELDDKTAGEVGVHEYAFHRRYVGSILNLRTASI